MAGAAGVPGVDDALTSADVAVGKIELAGINEGVQARRVAAVVAAGAGTAEVNQRVKLFDVGQTPVCVVTSSWLRYTRPEGF